MGKKKKMAAHMVVENSVLALFFAFFAVFQLTVDASTHWVVTEDGKIQEQVYSVFYMRRPYDLVALMQQEKRAQLVENFMYQVDGQIEEIDSKRNKETNLQEKFYVTDKDCVMAEKPLTDYNMFVSTIATCRDVDVSLASLYEGVGSVEPDEEPNCTRMSDLDFSMHTFEHLQSMRDRKNITIALDAELGEILSSWESVEMFGQLVHDALENNKTSWILYNLAGYYFRLVGDGYKAIECVRRALHFSPKELKYVALLNLGNVLHHAQQSEDAAVVVLAAVDITPDDPMLHYMLGNIYATLAQYNKSVESFNAALELRPDFEAAALRRHAVLCHSKLEIALETQYDSLQKTLMELGDFEQRLDFWQKQQLKLLQEQASLEVRLGSQIDYAEWKIRQKIKTHIQDSPQILQSGQSAPMIANVKIQVGHTWSHLFKEVETQAAKLKEELLTKQNELSNKMLPSGSEQSAFQNTPKYPKQHHKSSLSEPPPKHLLPDWPSEDECQVPETKEEIRLSLPAFIPPENKGFEVGKVLGDLKDVSEDEEPPVCEAEVTADFDNLWDWMFVNMEASEEEISVARKIILGYIHNYCGQITIEEFGRRLTYAINHELAPKWLLYHLSFFYWWALGDMGNFSRCLINTKVLAPQQCKDLILVPVASLMGQEGLLTGAIYSAKFALQVNEFEPTTNKLLADLYVLAGELQNAIKHYRKVLQEEPEDQEALKSYLWVMCRLRAKQQELERDGHASNQDEKKEDDSDTPVWINLADEEIEGHCHHSSIDGDCVTNKNAATTEESNDNVPDEDPKLDAANDLDDVFPPGDVYGGDVFPFPLEREPQKIHLKLSLGQQGAIPPNTQIHSSNSNTKPLVEDDPLPDILLQVNNRAGIPPPEPSECKSYPQANFKHFTSTWLSVSAKGVAVNKLLNTNVPVTGPPLQPYCDANLPSSALTLDHLAGMRHRSILTYSAETGLREALQTLGHEGEGPEAVETMGTRLTLALQQNSTSWVFTTLAALYWRVTGQAEQAIICLRQALHYAPNHMRDIPLISLANIFHRAGLHNDALIVGNMALEISPGFVVIHFTLANIFAAKGNLDQAKSFYESTLALQSSFEPARDRLRAIYCSTLWSDDNAKLLKQ